MKNNRAELRRKMLSGVAKVTLLVMIFATIFAGTLSGAFGIESLAIQQASIDGTQIDNVDVADAKGNSAAKLIDLSSTITAEGTSFDISPDPSKRGKIWSTSDTHCDVNNWWSKSQWRLGCEGDKVHTGWDMAMVWFDFDLGDWYSKLSGNLEVTFSADLLHTGDLHRWCFSILSSNTPFHQHTDNSYDGINEIYGANVTGVATTSGENNGTVRLKHAVAGRYIRIYFGAKDNNDINSHKWYEKGIWFGWVCYNNVNVTLNRTRKPYTIDYDPNGGAVADTLENSSFKFLNTDQKIRKKTFEGKNGTYFDTYKTEPNAGTIINANASTSKIKSTIQTNLLNGVTTTKLYAQYKPIQFYFNGGGGASTTNGIPYTYSGADNVLPTFYVLEGKSGCFYVNVAYLKNTSEGKESYKYKVDYSSDGTTFSETAPTTASDIVYKARIKIYKSNNDYLRGTWTVNFKIIPSDFGRLPGASGNWGSKTNPYVIENADHLTNLSNIVNGYTLPLDSVNGVNAGTTSCQGAYETVSGAKYFRYKNCYFVVKNNITANTGFNPIGKSSARYFGGTFYGGTKPIDDAYTYHNRDNFAINLSLSVKTVTNPDATVSYSELGNYFGLFGYTDGATIENITVAGDITCKSVAGGIVAYANNTKIHGCRNNATILANGLYTSISNKKGAYLGGIVGYANGGEILNCYNASNVSTSSSWDSSNYVGGIAGYAANGTIQYCYVEGRIGGSSAIGGIVGESAADISYCYFNGTMVAVWDSSGAQIGYISGSGTVGTANLILPNASNTGNAGNATITYGTDQAPKVTVNNSVGLYPAYKNGSAWTSQISTENTNLINWENITKYDVVGVLVSADIASGKYLCLDAPTEILENDLVIGADKETPTQAGNNIEAKVYFTADRTTGINAKVADITFGNNDTVKYENGMFKKEYDGLSTLPTFGLGTDNPGLYSRAMYFKRTPDDPDYDSMPNFVAMDSAPILAGKYEFAVEFFVKDKSTGKEKDIVVGRFVKTFLLGKKLISVVDNDKNIGFVYTAKDNSVSNADYVLGFGYYDTYGNEGYLSGYVFDNRFGVGKNSIPLVYQGDVYKNLLTNNNSDGMWGNMFLVGGYLVNNGKYDYTAEWLRFVGAGAVADFGTLAFRAYYIDGSGNKVYISDMSQISLDERDPEPKTITLVFESLDKNYLFDTEDNHNSITYTLLVSDFGGRFYESDWGSSANPFIISTPEHLLRLSAIVNGGIAWNSIQTTDKHLCVTNNDNVSEFVVARTYSGAYFTIDSDLIVSKDTGFVPIGGHGHGDRVEVGFDVENNEEVYSIKSGKYFAGTVEGNSHTITVVQQYSKEDEPNDSDFIGLFGVLCNAEISNLNVIACGEVNSVTGEPTKDMTGGNYVGALAGLAVNGKIENVTSGTGDYLLVYASRIDTSSNDGDFVGGIVGGMYGSVIKSCISRLFKYAGNNFVGGMVGYSRGGSIESPNIYESEKSKLVPNGKKYVGGVVGKAESTTIKGFNAGKFFTGWLKGEQYVGSIAGYWSVTHNAQLAAQEMTRANVLLDTNNQLRGPIAELAQSNQNMSVEGVSFVGGLVGYFDASNCEEGFGIRPRLIGTQNAHNSMTVSGTNYVGVLFGVFMGGGYKKDSPNFNSRTDTYIQIIPNYFDKDTHKWVYNISAKVQIDAGTDNSANVIGGLFGYVANAGIVFGGSANYANRDDLGGEGDNANIIPVMLATGKNINQNTRFNFVGLIAGILGENATIESVPIPGGNYNQITLVTAHESLNGVKNDFIGRIAGYVASNAGIKNGESGTMFGNRMISVVAGALNGRNFVGGMFGAMGKAIVESNANNLVITEDNRDGSNTILTIKYAKGTEEHRLLLNALNGNKNSDNSESTTTLVFAPRTTAIGEFGQAYGRIANRGVVKGTMYVGGIVGAVLGNARLEFVNPQWSGSEANPTVVYDGNYVFNGQHTYIISGAGTAQLEAAQITGTKYIGGIAGYLGTGAHLLERVVSRAIINGGSSGQYIGGIAGYMNSGIIRNCMTAYTGSASSIRLEYNGTYDYDIYRGAKWVGGIVGYLEAGNIIDSVSTGMRFDGFADGTTPTGSARQDANTIGGVAGYATQNAKVENSWAVFVSTKASSSTRPANEWGKYVIISNAIKLVPSYVELARMIGLYNFDISSSSINASTVDNKAQYGELSIGAKINALDLRKQIAFYAYRTASPNEFTGINNQVTVEQVKADFKVLKNENDIVRMRLKAFGDDAQDSMVVCVIDVEFGTIPKDTGNTTTNIQNAQDAYRAPSGDTRYKFVCTSDPGYGDYGTIKSLRGCPVFSWKGTNVVLGNYDNTFEPGTSGAPYLIEKQSDWDAFAWNIYTGTNDYAGKYVKLTTDEIKIYSSNDHSGYDFTKSVDNPKENNKGATSNVGYNLAGNIQQGEKQVEKVTVGGQGGKVTPQFKGTFDGDGHTINVEIDKTNDLYHHRMSVFPNAQDATFKNLTISGKVIAGTDAGNAGYDIAAFVGKPFGNLTFENCTNSATISGLRNVAGMTGYTSQGYNINFVGCVNTGDITSYEGSYSLGNYKTNNTDYAYDKGWKSTYGYPYGTGGIMGGVKGDLTIESCRNSGKIVGSHNVGGIIGRADGDPDNGVKTLTINNCANTGNVLANSGYFDSSGKEGPFDGRTSIGVRQNIFGYVGGLVGKTGAFGILKMYSSYNSGTVTTYANIAGGLIGGVGAYHQDIGEKNQFITGGKSVIAYCYNVGRVNAGGTYPKSCLNYQAGRENFGGSVAGGIAGIVGNILITQTYNAGDVYAYGSIGYAMTYQIRLGGIVGQSQPQGTTGVVRFRNCYNVGNVNLRAYNNDVPLTIFNLQKYGRYAAGISGFCDMDDDNEDANNPEKRIYCENTYSITCPVSIQTAKNEPKNGGMYSSSDPVQWNGEKRGQWAYAENTPGTFVANYDLVKTGTLIERYEQFTAFINAQGNEAMQMSVLGESTATLTEKIDKLASQDYPSSWLYVYGCLPQLACFALDTQNGLSMMSKGYGRDEHGDFVERDAGEKEYPYIIKDGVEMLALSSLANMGFSFEGKYIEFANKDNNLFKTESKYINFPTGSGVPTNAFKASTAIGSGYAQGKSYHLYQKGAVVNRSIWHADKYAPEFGFNGGCSYDGIERTDAEEFGAWVSYNYAFGNSTSADTKTGATFADVNMIPIGCGGQEKYTFQGNISGRQVDGSRTELRGLRMATNSTLKKDNIVFTGVFGRTQNANISYIGNGQGIIKAYGGANEIAIAGGIVGVAGGNTTIDNCGINGGEVEGVRSGSKSDSYSGGIVGIVTNELYVGNNKTYTVGSHNVVSNCWADGNASIEAAKSNAGGIAGYASATRSNGTVMEGSFVDIENCTVRSATIGANNTTTGKIENIGGIIATNDKNILLTIKGCKVGDTSTAVNIKGSYAMGGIMGSVTGNARIEDCTVGQGTLIERTNTGTISTYGTPIGGFVGYSVNSDKERILTFSGELIYQGTIKLAGTKTGTDKNIGGIIGYMGSGSVFEDGSNVTISAVTGKKSIDFSKAKSTTRQNIGGVAGITKDVVFMGEFDVQPVMDLGTANSISNIGGFIGNNNGICNIVADDQVSILNPDKTVTVVGGTKITIGGEIGVSKANNVGGFIGNNNSGTLNIGPDEANGVRYEGSGLDIYIGIMADPSEGASDTTVKQTKILGQNNVGGFVGNNSGTKTSGGIDIKKGNVRISDTTSISGNNYVGGVIGNNAAQLTTGKSIVPGASFIVRNSGAVSGNDYVGGVFGYLKNADISRNTFLAQANQGGQGVLGRQPVNFVDRDPLRITVEHNMSAIGSDFFNNGTVTATGNYVGGVIGYMIDSTINNCYFENEGAVVATLGADTVANNVGGVIGYMDAGSKIYGGQFVNLGTVSGNKYVGGSIGFMQEGAKIVLPEEVVESLLQRAPIKNAAGGIGTGSSAQIGYGVRIISGIQFTNGVRPTISSIRDPNESGDMELMRRDALTSADSIESSNIDARISGNKYVGGSIGMMKGEIDEASFINAGVVGGYTDKEVYYVGGSVAVIDGSILKSKFNNTSTEMKISGANVVGGSVGMVGENSNATIKDTHFEFNGDLTVTNSTGSSDKYVGIGGSIGVIKNVNEWSKNTFYSNGKVTASGKIDDSGVASKDIGAINVGGSIGLIVEQKIKIIIENMLSYETSVEGNDRVGGIVGAVINDGRGNEQTVQINNSFNVRGFVKGKTAGGIVGIATGNTFASTSYWVKNESNINLEMADISNLKDSLGKTGVVTIDGSNLSDAVSTPSEYIDNAVAKLDSTETENTNLKVASTQDPETIGSEGGKYTVTTTYTLTVEFKVGEKTVKINIIRVDVVKSERIVTERDAEGNPTATADTELSRKSTYSFSIIKEDESTTTPVAILTDGTIQEGAVQNVWNDILQTTDLAEDYTYTNGYYVYSMDGTIYTTGTENTGWYFVYADSVTEGYINTLYSNFKRVITLKNRSDTMLGRQPLRGLVVKDKHTFGGSDDAKENDKQAWKYIANAYTEEELAIIARMDTTATDYDVVTSLIVNPSEGQTFSPQHIYATATKGRNITDENGKPVYYYLYMATSGMHSGKPVRPVVTQGDVYRDKDKKDTEPGYFINFATTISEGAGTTENSVQNIAIYYRRVQYRDSIIYNGYERKAPLMDDTDAFRNAGYNFSFTSDKTPIAVGSYTSTGSVMFDYKGNNNARDFLQMSSDEGITFGWEITKANITINTDGASGGIYGENSNQKIKVTATGISPMDRVGDRQVSLIIKVKGKNKTNPIATITVKVKRLPNGSYDSDVEISGDASVTAGGASIFVGDVVFASSDLTFGPAWLHTKNTSVRSGSSWYDLSVELNFKYVDVYSLEYDADDTPNTTATELVNYKLKANPANVKVDPKELTVSLDPSKSGRLFNNKKNTENVAWEVTGWKNADTLNTEFVDNKGKKASYFNMIFGGNTALAYYSADNKSSYSTVAGANLKATVNNSSNPAKNYVEAGENVFENVGYYVLKLNGTKAGNKLVIGNYYFSTDTAGCLVNSNNGYYTKDAYVIGMVEIVITQNKGGEHIYGDKDFGEATYTIQIREKKDSGTSDWIVIDDFYKQLIVDSLKLSDTQPAKTLPFVSPDTFNATDLKVDSKVATFTLTTERDAGKYSAELVQNLDNTNVYLEFNGKSVIQYTIEKRTLDFAYIFSDGFRQVVDYTFGHGNIRKHFDYNTKHQGVSQIEILNIAYNDDVKILLDIGNIATGWKESKSSYVSGDIKITTSDTGIYNIGITGLSGTKKDNYKLITGTPGVSWVIDPKELTIESVGGGSNPKYDGKPHEPKLTMPDCSNGVYGGRDHISLEYSIDGNLAGEMIDAGTYLLKYDPAKFIVKRDGGSTVGDNGAELKNNYTINGVAGEIEFTIDKAELKLQWTANTLYYSGKAQGQTVSSVSYAGGTATVSNNSFTAYDALKLILRDQGTNAGSYTMRATLDTSVTKAKNYKIVNDTDKCAYTINKAQVSWTATSSNAKKVYDATTEFEGGVNVTWKKLLGEYDMKAGDYSIKGVYDNKNVGTGKTVTFRITLNGNIANNVDCANDEAAISNGEIEQAELVVTMDKLRNGKATKAYDGTKFYGGQNGFANGDLYSMIYRSGEGFVVTGFPNEETLGTVRIYAEYVETTEDRSKFDSFVNNVVGSGSAVSISATKKFYKKLVFTIANIGTEHNNAANYKFKVMNGTTSIATSTDGVAEVFDKNEIEDIRGEQNSGISIEITVKALKAEYSNTAQSYAKADNTYNTDWKPITGIDATTKKGLTISVLNGWMTENGSPKVYKQYTVIRGKEGSDILSASIAKKDDGSHINYRLSNQPILTIGYFVVNDDYFEIGSMASLIIAAYYQQTNDPGFNQPIIEKMKWYKIVSATDYATSGSFESQKGTLKPSPSAECDSWDDYFAELENAGLYVFLNTSEGNDADGEWGYYGLEDSNTVPIRYNAFKQVANVDGVLTDTDISILNSFFTLYNYNADGSVSIQHKEWGFGKAYVKNFLNVGAGNVAVVLGSIFKGEFTGTYDGNGYTINHVNIMSLPGLEGVDNTHVGMFANITTGTVKNVHLRNFSITANGNSADEKVYVGGIAGESAMPIENCSFHGSITTTENTSTMAMTIGGIVGQTSANVNNVIVLGNINAKAYNVNVGGVIGRVANGSNIQVNNVVSMMEILVKENMMNDAIAGKPNATTITSSNVYYLSKSAYVINLSMSARGAGGTRMEIASAFGTAVSYDTLFKGSNSGYTSAEGTYDVIANMDVNSGEAPRESLHLSDLVKVYLLMYSQSATSGYYKVSDSSWLVGSADGTSTNPIIIANQQDVALLREIRFATFKLANNVELYSTRPQAMFDGVFYGTVVANGHTITIHRNGYTTDRMFELELSTLPITWVD